MKTILFYFLVPSLLFVNLAHADIVGGDEVQDQDPVKTSTAALYQPNRDGRGGALCTASLIGQDVAVTAAHCIQPGGADPVMLFGRDVHSASTVKRPVTGSVVNSKWRTHAGKGMDEGDIALVKFPGGLPAGYAPVKTAKSEDSVRTGTTATLAGYGITNSRTQSGAGVLRKTKVDVADSRPGKTEMILDQSHGHGACHGDSGGPAFVNENGKMVLAGVTNRSYPARAPDDCGHKVVYTKVSAYRDWMKNAEKKLHGEGTDGAVLAAHTPKTGRRMMQAKVGGRKKTAKSKVAIRSKKAAASPVRFAKRAVHKKTRHG